MSIAYSDRQYECASKRYAENMFNIINTETKIYSFGVNRPTCVTV